MRGWGVVSTGVPTEGGSGSANIKHWKPGKEFDVNTMVIYEPLKTIYYVLQEFVASEDIYDDINNENISPIGNYKELEEGSTEIEFRMMTWKENHRYLHNTLIVNPNTNIVYRVIDDYTSSNTLDADIIEGNLTAINVFDTFNIDQVIDDINIRGNRTFSSDRLVEYLFNNYTSKNDVYTKERSDSRFSLKENEHVHDNRKLLDKFSFDVNKGILLFDRNELLMEKNVDVLELNGIGSHSMLTPLLDNEDILIQYNFKIIEKTEFIAQNENPHEYEEDAEGNITIPEEDKLHIVIYDGDIKLIDVAIDPEETQRYEFGFSPSVKVYVKGNYKYKYNVLAH